MTEKDGSDCRAGREACLYSARGDLILGNPERFRHPVTGQGESSPCSHGRVMRYWKHVALRSDFDDVFIIISRLADGTIFSDGEEERLSFDPGATHKALDTHIGVFTGWKKVCWARQRDPRKGTLSGWMRFRRRRSPYLNCGGG